MCEWDCDYEWQLICTQCRQCLLYRIFVYKWPHLFIVTYMWCVFRDYFAPPPRRGALSDDTIWLLTSVCLSDVCLSVAYIGPKSRTERPRKTKIGTEVAHGTRDLDTTFKVKRSKVKGQDHMGGAYCGGLPHSLLRTISLQSTHFLVGIRGSATYFFHSLG